MSYLLNLSTNKKHTNIYHSIFMGIVCILLSSCALDEIEDLSNISDTTLESKNFELLTTSNDIHLEATTLTDIPYGNHPEQVYDIYLPSGRKFDKTKIILLIHGGSWVSGDKDAMSTYVTYLLEYFPQHAIVNINYVLAQVPVIPAFPNQYLDIDAVINHIVARQNQFQILPEFGFVGSSAGAHLALVYDQTYDIDNRVKFVANIVGPADFTDPFYANDPNFQTNLSLFVDEDAYPPGTDYAVVNSPAQLISEASSPIISFYGKSDPIVPTSNAKRLNQSLDSYDIEREMYGFEGGHVSDWSDQALLDVRKGIGEFIYEFLPIK